MIEYSYGNLVDDTVVYIRCGARLVCVLPSLADS